MVGYAKRFLVFLCVILVVLMFSGMHELVLEMVVLVGGRSGVLCTVSRVGKRGK